MESTMNPQTARIETISPDEAAQILADNNNRNRPMRETKARQLASAILRGEWKLNGETIIFGASGTLLTGQHRLRACALSGVSIKSWVVRGVDDSAFDTVDQGTKKTNGDVLAIGGEANALQVAAAARWVLVIEDKGTFASRSPTAIEVESVLSRHPSLRRWASRVMASKPAKRLMHSYVIAVLAIASERYGDAAVDRLFEHIADGCGLQKGSPALLLRERLLEQSQYKRIDPKIMTAMTIKAVIAFMQGKDKIGFLRWLPGEAWPAL